MKKSACFALLLSAIAFAQTAVPKPDPKNYSTWDEYNEAIIDWKIQQSKLPKQEPKCLTVQSCKAALRGEMEANRMLVEQLDAAKKENESKGAVVTQISDNQEKVR